MTFPKSGSYREGLFTKPFYKDPVNEPIRIQWKVGVCYFFRGS